jgi:hypothetical protein
MVGSARFAISPHLHPKPLGEIDNTATVSRRKSAEAWLSPVAQVTSEGIALDPGPD